MYSLGFAKIGSPVKEVLHHLSILVFFLLSEWCFGCSVPEFLSRANLNYPGAVLYEYHD